jgi:membrane-bound serine protease (ClpP class)
MNVCVRMMIAGALLASAGNLPAAPGSAGLIEIKGVIGPATASYIDRATHVSAERNDVCLIIQLDTPGGLVSSTEDITQSIYASKVPVVVYVSPSGAGATSAGTFITMAADFAVMAPHTRIGAAHPVGPMGEGETNSVMWTKAENDVASMAKSIAKKRGRNAEWAESAVRQSVSITSEEALDLNVVDLIAKDVPELLEKINGREWNGKKLETAGIGVAPIAMSWGEKLFQMLFHPQVLLLLMAIAGVGIMGEINHPGAILPGVVGAIALILFLYLSTILPVNAAGIALIILSVILFAIDLYAPTHGVLTAGGLISFFLGALLLFRGAGPAFHLSLAWIIPTTVVIGLFFIFVLGAGLRAQRLPVQAGRETLIGKLIPAESRIDAASGKVFVEGEYWNAVSETPIEPGRPVEIVGIDGLTLKVKPKT